MNPNYVVSSGTIGRPFESAEQAIKWHNYLMKQGVSTVIIDLSDYDWDSNPMNIQHRNISEFAKGVVM